MSVYDGVAGQAPVKRSLKEALSGGRFSHAYLFVGPEGTGKRKLAGIAAKTLVCEAPAGGEPCGACLSCALCESGNHPDIIRIKPDKKDTVSAELIRTAVVSDADIKPYRAAHKVYILENAGLMSVAAQNILLKTLEEPPPYGVFLLCADSAVDMLATVLSRCVVFRTVPLGYGDVAAYLRKHYGGLTDGGARFIAAMSGGSVGKAMALAAPDEGENEPRIYKIRAALLAVLRGITNETPAGILLKTRGLEAYKDDAGLLMDIASAWYRDAAVRGTEGGGDRLMMPDIPPGHIERRTAEDAFDALSHIEEARRSLEANAGFALTMEVLMLKLGRKII